MAGYDNILILGKTENLIYLLIEDDQMYFKAVVIKGTKP